MLGFMRGSSGGIIPLFALLLAILIGVTALVIDTTLFSTSGAQHRQTAEFAVLSALKIYSEEIAKPGNTPLDALHSAVNNAKSVINDNLSYNVARSFFHDQTVSQNLIGIRSDTTLSNDNGILVPIRWYFVSHDPSCNSAARPSGCPCEQACSEDLADDQPADGLRLEYKTNPASLFDGFLGRIFGNRQYSHQVSVNVTLAPRNAIFLIDLSLSMADESHTKHSPVPPAYCSQDVFAYEVYAGESCDPVTSTSFGDGYDQTQDYATFYTQNADGSYGSSYGDIDNWLRCVRKAPFPDPPHATNIENQYPCLSVTVNYADGGGNEVRQYRIDKGRRPEPLSSVLDGIHTAMKFFQDRKVPGDRIGIIGFDSGFGGELVTNRILAEDITGNIRPVTINDAQFADFLEATDTSIPIDDASHPNRIQKYLFPRVYLRDHDTPAGSDLASALDLARQMIVHTNTYSQAQNFVVDFTDGLSNCKDSSVPLSSRCYGGPGTSDPESDQPYYTDGTNLLINQLNQFKTDKIAFHLFLVGANMVAPHELAWKGQDGCATQDETSALALPLADGITGSSYANIPFYGPNDLWTKVQETGGLWAPLRPCMKVNGACSAFDPTSFKNDCNTIVNSPLSRPVSTHGYWDANGRIIYDPLGLSTTDQVLGYMDRVLSRSPFIMVEE